MISVKFENGKITKNKNLTVEVKTFKDLNIKEEHIEDYVEEYIGELLADEDESLLIIGKQTSNTSRHRSDLIAIDIESGDLVLIEIKRDVNDIKGRGETFVAQAIKYASSLATIKTLEEIVGLYAEYLDKKESDQNNGETNIDKARRIIYRDFTESTINKDQRIILIASDFDDVTMASATWLSEKGVNIKVIRLMPKLINSDLYIEHEILLGKKESPYIPFGEYKSKSSESRSKISKTILPRMPKLFDWGFIKKDDKVYIKRNSTIESESEAVVIDENTVKYNNKKMSFNEWGQTVTGWSSIQIYKFVTVNESQETLHDMRMKKIEEMNDKEND
jgi:hypothetical protein